VIPSAVVSSLDGSAGTGEHNWHIATRVAFRATFVYALLVWAPLTVYSLTGSGWWDSVATAVGYWGITQVLGLPEHSAPYVGIATRLPPVIGSLVFAAASLLLAAVWSVLDRAPRGHPRLFAWLYAGVRFLLGASLLFYGFAKVFPGQFGLGVQPDVLVRQVGGLERQELLWAFMGASRSYTMFTGLIELTAGLLLLSRRTATLGALIAVGAISQVLMLNIAYDVIVKLFAAQLLLMAVFLAMPVLRALVDVLVLGRSGRPAQVRGLFKQPALDRLMRVGGAVVAVALVGWFWNGALDYAERRHTNRQAQLYGVWEREVAGDWRYFVVPWNGAVVLVSDGGAVERYASKVDATARSVALMPLRAPGQSVAAPKSFTFSQPDADSLILVDAAGGASIRLRQREESDFSLNDRTNRWAW
jgi:hypothetical protein